MLISNMRNPKNTSGDAQFMQHKSPLLWFLHKNHDRNSNPPHLLMAWHSTTYKVQKIWLTNIMLNHQMFGTKKFTTHHPMFSNKPPKVLISNWAENFQDGNVFHQALTPIESFWFYLHMGENWIPKVEWQIIPQLPNQPLASKTFCFQNFCSFTWM
jgi:hypothetical protein